MSRKSRSSIESYQDAVAKWLVTPYSKSSAGWKILFSPSGIYKLNPKADAPRIAELCLQTIYDNAKAASLCFRLSSRVESEFGLSCLSSKQRFRVGAFLLNSLIRADACYLFNALSHPDYHSYIIKTTSKELRERTQTYTQFKPFPKWSQPTDEYGNELVKSFIWHPDEWHFDQTKKPLVKHHPLFWDTTLHEKGSVKICGVCVPKKERDKALGYVPPSGPAPWVQAVNRLESNSYRINDELLGIAEKLGKQRRFPGRRHTPSYAGRKRRFDNVIQEAKRLSDRRFYQRAHVEFRGRMYLSKSPLNYQGDDLSRAVIEFSSGKRLTKDGLMYLRLHAANCFGETGTIDQRVDWARQNEKQLIRYAKKPIETFKDWSKAKHQFRFLRACLELRDARAKKSFSSRLPIELDQSNSAFQHIALLYGDDELAKKSNLIALSDFYDDLAKGWNPNVKLNKKERRAVIKAIVLPYSYGAGVVRIAKENLIDLDIPAINRMTDEGRKELARSGVALLCQYAPIVERYKSETKQIAHQLLWKSVKPSGSSKGSNRRKGKKNKIRTSVDRMQWTTPSGFEVHTSPRKTESDFVRIYKGRRGVSSDGSPYAQIVARHRTSTVLTREMEVGVMANFVHSVDAAVAHWVFCRTDFPIISIQDAFACHASNVHKMRKHLSSVLEMVHRDYTPLNLLKRDVLGKKMPTGLITWTSRDVQAIDLAREVGQSQIAFS